MIYLGLDLGSKTLGMAKSDPSGMLASVLETYRFNENSYKKAINYTVEVIKREKVDCVILGYPKHMNGDIGDRARLSEMFKEELHKRIDTKVILWDERLTSSQVNNIMIMGDTSRKKRKEKKDELAAVVILQSYLDSL